ncbi:MAG TPA: hypothetical protein VEJ63_13830 [Planctomycetota bacterium]|nr:hypothetical protein [Planctomycetota bacterium]
MNLNVRRAPHRRRIAEVKRFAALRNVHRLHTRGFRAFLYQWTLYVLPAAYAVVAVLSFWMKVNPTELLFWGFAFAPVVMAGAWPIWRLIPVAVSKCKETTVDTEEMNEANCIMLTADGALALAGLFDLTVELEFLTWNAWPWIVTCLCCCFVLGIWGLEKWLQRVWNCPSERPRTIFGWGVDLFVPVMTLILSIASICILGICLQVITSPADAC